MSFSNFALFDVLRVLANGSISATYAKLGTALTHRGRAFCITNVTDGDMFVAVTNGSTPASDGSADNMFIPAGGFRLYDVTSDAMADSSMLFASAVGQQFWVRYSTAPTVKSVYLELLYGKGE